MNFTARVLLENGRWKDFHGYNGDAPNVLVQRVICSCCGGYRYRWYALVDPPHVPNGIAWYLRTA